MPANKTDHRELLIFPNRSRPSPGWRPDTLPERLLVELLNPGSTPAPLRPRTRFGRGVKED